jgi:hypothetical protein
MTMTEKKELPAVDKKQAGCGCGCTVPPLKDAKAVKPTAEESGK